MGKSPSQDRRAHFDEKKYRGVSHPMHKMFPFFSDGILTIMSVLIGIIACSLIAFLLLG